MSTEEVFVQQFAKLFLHYREALTPDPAPPVDRNLRDSGEFSGAERECTLAAARLALIEIESAPTEQDSRRYYANPGEAEWGCQRRVELSLRV